MAGMWGIKKTAFSVVEAPIQTLFMQWKQTKVDSDFWSDTRFLCDVIYGKIVYISMIHDETQQFEPTEFCTKFSYPIVNNHFVGQVYEYEDGKEYAKFSYRT